MPTISLRLTEEEHVALKAWAHDSRRSLQKEAVWRLFADPERQGAREVISYATLSERGKAMVSEETSEQLREVEGMKQPSRSESRHVTTDFKPVRK